MAGGIGCARALFFCLAAGTALAACGDRSHTETDTGPLPADPQEWICEGAKPSPRPTIDAWCRAHPDRGQPVPSDLRNPPPPSDFFAYQEYNVRLKKFLTRQEYAIARLDPRQNWRFSGPSVLAADGSFSHNYGPHFPLRVYYSPEVVDWLCNGRQGEIPDGAMIMKAMTIVFDHARHPHRPPTAAWTSPTIRRCRSSRSSGRR